MEVPVPSLRWRAFVVLVLLVGFYIVTFVLSAVLFVLPFVHIYFGGFHGLVNVLSFVACWAPAFVILMAALGARPPKFSPDGIELFPSQNPALYALVEEVAQKAGTSAPSQIFLMAMPMAGVVEVGGFFARKSRRVLLLGAPLLSGITIEQLRAILAHEMGHFIGGETRLTGVISYAKHTFAAVYEASLKRGTNDGLYGGLASEATHAVGTGYVRLYMRLFLACTQPTSRKQEIAADALSVRLCGKKAAIGALERAHVVAPLYRAYLENEVSVALAAGAAPIELLEGFDVFCAKISERGLHSKLDELVRAEKTDPFDSHPAYSDRVAMMETFAEGPPVDVPNGERSALELVEVDPEKLRSWLVDLLLDTAVAGRGLPRLTWSTIMEKKLPAKIRKDAKGLVEVLGKHFPRVKGTPARRRRAVARRIPDHASVRGDAPEARRDHRRVDRRAVARLRVRGRARAYRRAGREGDDRQRRRRRAHTLGRPPARRASCLASRDRGVSVTDELRASVAGTPFELVAKQRVARIGLSWPEASPGESITDA